MSKKNGSLSGHVYARLGRVLIPSADRTKGLPAGIQIPCLVHQPPLVLIPLRIKIQIQL